MNSFHDQHFAEVESVGGSAIINTRSEAFRMMDSIFEPTLTKGELIERVKSLEPGLYRAFIVGVDNFDTTSKASRSGFFSNLAKKASFARMRSGASTSNSDLNPLANLKKAFSLLVRMLKSNKRVNDQSKQPEVDTVTAIERKEDENEETHHYETQSLADDEYARILEDLELMAEEKIRTLLENSVYELPSQSALSMSSSFVTSRRQLNSIPEKSVTNFKH